VRGLLTLYSLFILPAVAVAFVVLLGMLAYALGTSRARARRRRRRLTRRAVQRTLDARAVLGDEARTVAMRRVTVGR
jgi:peptidoglycan/LPS O-acetylase OafA/YrhL